MEYIVSPSDGDLVHYGVMGMKWGVRKDQRKLGSASRIAAKRQHIEGKISKSGYDKDLILRNTVNDYRRGRVAGLQKKEAHRAAKEAYAKNATEANKQRVKETRNERLKYNVGSKALGIDVISRGTYNRYRQQGDAVTKAILKTAGKNVVTNLAISGTTKIGQEAGDQLFELLANR